MKLPESPLPRPFLLQIRRIALRTADGLNPTPMAISWVRDGVLMCGMDNEIAVYSQWRDDAEEADAGSGGGSGAAGADKDIVDHRNLQETDILNLAHVSSRGNWGSMPLQNRVLQGAERSHLFSKKSHVSPCFSLPFNGL